MNLALQLRVERWPLREPFEIAREVMHALPLLHLKLSDRDGHCGQAESAGVDYDGETPTSMVAQIRAVAHHLHNDITRAELQALLPAGGARNALDCALWDLHAKRSGTPAWQQAGLPPWQPVLTAFTIGLGNADDTRRRIRAAQGLPLIKLKVDGTRHLSALAMARELLPEARIVIDANQAWTPTLLERLLPALQTAGVELIEQPLPRGEDAALVGFAPPIPLAADESCTDRHSLDALQGRYQVVNLKLDKCGGLTEALALAHEARKRGFELMVGNMCGTSLGMAPALLLAQMARWADLDGPLLQSGDRTPAMAYVNGVAQLPQPALWG